MKVLRTYPDVERLVVDHLGSQVEGFTVAVGGPPDDWTTASDPHVQVNLDATATVHPISATSTVRLTAWSASPTTSKRIVQECQALMLYEPGDGIVHTRPGAGLITAHDDDHDAELASLTVLVRTRSTGLG